MPEIVFSVQNKKICLCESLFTKRIERIFRQDDKTEKWYVNSIQEKGVSMLRHICAFSIFKVINAESDHKERKSGTKEFFRSIQTAIV